MHFEIFPVDFLAENCYLIRGHKKSLTDFESFKRLLEDELFVDHLNKELDSKTFQKLSKNSLQLYKIGLEWKRLFENFIWHWINEIFIFIQDLIFNWSSAFGVSEKC